MFPIEYQYNPKQTVWSVDSNNFLVTELVVVDVRAKVFPKNSTLHQEIKYNTKTPRLGIFSTQSPDNLYETLEDAIESLINVPGDWSHNPFPYSIDYLANPLETIWFVDRSTLAIYSGIVESVHIKTFMKSNTLIDEIEYQVKTKLKGVETYKRVKENEIFLSYEEAFESMFGVYPTPTPTNTFGISPTPTPTHTPTPTPSLTPSITVSNSPTPTPTAGASMTPSASLTPTPSVTMTMTLTPEMTPTVTPTSSITPSITQSLTPTPSASPVWAPDHIPEILLTSKKNASGILLRRGMVVSMNSSGELIRAAASGADAINATTFDGIDILRANYEQFIPIFHNGIIYTPYEYSTDLGQTKHTIPEASSSNMFSPVIIDDMAVLTFTEYDNVLGKFVPKIITTEDAVTWNTIDPIIDDENMNFQQIHFCDGRYTTNNLFRSDDLLNWEAFSIKQTPPSSKWNYFDWNDLTNVDFITSGTFSTDTNLFLFGTNPNDSTLWCRISEDAETYVGVPQTTPRNPLFTNSTHLFVIEDEFVKKTVDASTYDTVIESIDNEVYIFADEDYLFSKDDTTAYAIDLNTLTRITTDLNVDVKAIVNFSGAYIGISDTSVFYSEDGISWDENPIPGVNRDYTNSYIFVAGSVVFIVAAGDGYNQMSGTYALSSTDGVTWDEVFWEVYSYNNASMKELLSAPVYNPNNDSIVMEFTGEDYDLEKTVGMKFISFAPFEEFIHIYEGYDMNYKYMPPTSYFSGLTYFNEKFVFGLTPTVPSNNLSPIYSTTDFNDITITDMVESPVDMTVDRIVGSPYNNMGDVVTKEGDDTLNKAVLVVKRGMSGD